MKPKLVSLGYALPTNSYSQREIFDTYKYPPHFWRLFDPEVSQIEKRHSYIPLEKIRHLSFQEQQEWYLKGAIELSKQAIVNCLDGRDLKNIGCLVYSSCFLGESLVITDKGHKDINQISIGQKCLGHDGEWHTVTRVFSRPYDGTIIQIHLNTQPMIEVTPEHPFLIIRNPFKYMRSFHRRRVKGKLPNPQWVQAKELNPEDFLISPQPKFNSLSIKDLFYEGFPKQRGKNKMMSRVKKQIYSPDFLWLCGFYIAEGSLSGTLDDKRGIGFSLGLQEEALASRVVNVASKIGYPVTQHQNTNHSQYVIILSRNLATLFTGWFGRGAPNKKVPSWIFYLPEGLKKVFIEGMVAGDGHTSKTGGITYGTTSKELSIGLCILLQSLGERCSLHIQRTRKGFGDLPIYTVNFLGSGSTKYGQKLFFYNGKFLMPVKKITIRKYSGTVYNLEIAEVNSYVCGMVATHNCTGIAPGPTVGDYLIPEAGLKDDIYITNVASQGCQGGGFPGLKVAVDFTIANSKPAIVIACELSFCSYYPEPDWEPDPENDYELVRANSIFGDCVSAALIGFDNIPQHPFIVDSEAYTNTKYLGDLGFTWRNGRLRVLLSKRVRIAAAEVSSVAVNRLLERHGLEIKDIDYWVVHAAGARVLNMIRDTLGIMEEKLHFSREFLRNYGNVSSATVGGIGKLLMGQVSPKSGEYLVCVTVGPGMTGGATLFHFQEGE